MKEGVVVDAFEDEYNWVREESSKETPIEWAHWPGLFKAYLYQKMF